MFADADTLNGRCPVAGRSGGMWAARGQRYERALALARSADAEPFREAVRILDRLAAGLTNAESPTASWSLLQVGLE
jgi:hypothetical protein